MNRRLIFLIIFVSMLSCAPLLCAQEQKIEERPVAAESYAPRPTPQMWSMEVMTGFWMPKNAVLDSFFGKCCNLITRVQGGLLLDKRYGVEQSLGFLYKSGRAMGVLSGQPSQDSFNLILIPMATCFVWRADYFSWRYIVPYLRAGIDYVFFREGDRGSSTTGIKFGLDGGGGMAINIGAMGEFSGGMDSELGINELFVTLEGRYQWINNFGGGGLDLSGGVYSIGLLFEF